MDQINTAPKEKTMRHSSLTNSQRNAINRIIRYYKKDVMKTEKITELEIKNNKHFASICLRTQRTDSHEYSMRNIVCNHRLFAMIGKRGQIRVSVAESGLDNQTAHVAHMLKGVVA